MAYSYHQGGLRKKWRIPLQDIPFEFRYQMYFMHDGTPAHFLDTSDIWVSKCITINRAQKMINVGAN